MIAHSSWFQPEDPSENKKEKGPDPQMQELHTEGLFSPMEEPTAPTSFTAPTPTAEAATVEPLWEVPEREAPKTELETEPEEAINIGLDALESPAIESEHSLESPETPATPIIPTLVPLGGEESLQPQRMDPVAIELVPLDGNPEEAPTSPAEDSAVVIPPEEKKSFQQMMDEMHERQNSPGSPSNLAYKPIFLKNQEEEASRFGKPYWMTQGFAAFSIAMHTLQELGTKGNNPNLETLGNMAASTAATAAVVFTSIHFLAKLKHKYDINRIHRSMESASKMERAGIKENPHRGKIIWPLILAGAPLAGMHVAVKTLDILNSGTPLPLLKELGNIKGFPETLHRVMTGGMNILSDVATIQEKILVTGSLTGAAAGLLLALKMTKHARMHGIINVSRHWARAAVRRTERYRSPTDARDEALNKSSTPEPTPP